MRYVLPLGVLCWGAGLVGLHMAHRYPRPGSRDIARLIGCPTVTLAGVVADSPLTRWNQVRFVLHARTISPPGYKGNVAVTLTFPNIPVAPGDHLEVRGWLSPPRSAAGNRTFDELSYWASQDVYALFKVWSPESVIVYKPVSRWHPLAWTWTVRRRFCEFWYQALPEDEADLIIGLTIGGRGILTPEFKAECIRAGVYHIVVISGQNVAVVIALGLAIFQWVRWPRHRIWLLAIPPILFYAQLTGADPPVLRASLMAMYALVSAGLRRDPPRMYGLSVTAGLFLVFWPQAAFGASFQLSFAATVALMFGFTMIPKNVWPKKGIRRWFCEVFAACLIVHLGVWPVFVYYFHQISLAGFLAPFIVYPLATVGMFAGLLVGLAAVISPGWIPAWIIWPIDKLLRLIMGCITMLAHGSHASVHLLPLSQTRMILYYLGLFGILFSLYWRQRYAQKISPLRMHRARL
jgi:competence protein ComEC